MSPTDTIVGLSPRGRGKLARAPQSLCALRSIPAWAGETDCSRCIAALFGVYPRVGGGNIAPTDIQASFNGLSPRGRGKPATAAIPSPGSGSIPAWAGETCRRFSTDRLGRVYPRVGGGNPTHERVPRPHPGLSPRGRGKRVGASALTDWGGSIPAWAGETRRMSVFLDRIRVYPRVGGGNAHIAFCCLQGSGLSPRGRGKHIAAGLSPSPYRSIPAWAGETAQSGF